MSTFTTSMFASIKDALQKDTRSNSAATDIMRTTKGNSYVVRLVPNTNNPEKTFFHYYSHGWESFATGQYMSLVSPQTFGERDPIAEYRYKVHRTGTQQEKDKAKAIMRLEKWLVNVYVVDDPVNPENNGKIKILRYGKQLHNILMEAIEGEDAEQFGARIFDLGSEGCSLRVKVEDQGGFPTYVSSKFLMPGPVPGLTDTRAKEVQNEVITLDEVFNIKSYQELQNSLNDHYLCMDTADATTATPATETRDPDLDEEVPGLEPITKQPDTATASAEDDVSLDDDKIKELLQGLDD